MGSPETLTRNYHYTLCNITEDRRSELHAAVRKDNTVQDLSLRTHRPEHITRCHRLRSWFRPGPSFIPPSQQVFMKIIVFRCMTLYSMVEFCRHFE